MDNNDEYLVLTRKYLANYIRYRDSIKRLKYQIAEMDDILSDESIKGIKYGGEPGGGNGEFTQVEKSALIRMAHESQRAELLLKLKHTESLVRRIREAVDSLPALKRTIVKGFYFDLGSCKALAKATGYSDRWCRQILKVAEYDVMLALFMPDIGLVPC